MGQFLDLIPKNLLAFVAIVGGIFFIVFVIQPPHTLCDSQVEVINKAQERFLFENARSKRLLSGKTDKNLSTKYERLRDQCDNTNDPGGCYELFQEMRMLLRDLNSLTRECSSALASSGPYGKALRETLGRMVRIAWGTAPPVSYNVKLGWLDASDINLFCRLKERFVMFYGDDGWDRFRENSMMSLPGAKDLPRNQIWDLSIFSENCAKYP